MRCRDINPAPPLFFRQGKPSGAGLSRPRRPNLPGKAAYSKARWIPILNREDDARSDRLARSVLCVALLFVCFTVYLRFTPAPRAGPMPNLKPQPQIAVPTGPPLEFTVSFQPAGERICPVDGVNGNTVLTLGDAVYYEFGGHGSMSLGLDGTAIPYDVYYGVGGTAEGDALTVTWHNYTGSGTVPTALGVSSLYTGAEQSLGNVDGSEAAYILRTAGLPTGPYEVRVTWSDGEVTALDFYKNGDDLYVCQTANKSATYMCYWYDRKDAIDALLAEQGVTPENSLDFSDDFWAYPVPADYGRRYRCDNRAWAELAQAIAGDEALPDAQKAILIHDWMTENLAYDQYKVDGLGSTRAAVHGDYTGKYSMWDTKTGVCADFATVYCIMLRSLGVPAVSLDYNDEHVWNVVYLDGDWVEIDLTEDIGRIVYGEDVSQVVNAADTVDYGAFGTPYTIGTITPGIHTVNGGVYTRAYVTRENWNGSLESASGGF